MTYRIAMKCNGRDFGSFEIGLSKKDVYKKIADAYKFARVMEETAKGKDYSYVVGSLTMTKKGIINGFDLSTVEVDGRKTTINYRVRVEA